MIITEELVWRAIGLATPSALEILASEGTTWGPQWVEGFVDAPGLEEPISFIFGESTSWDDDWGEFRSFSEIAITKLDVADREGLPTSVVAATMPWVLDEGEYLYAGGTTRNGITVATSGAKGRTDEGLAEILLACIIMLAMLELDQRVKAEEMQI